MEVEVLESTQNPEKVVVQAARNDYMKDWVGDNRDVEKLLSGTDPADPPKDVRNRRSSMSDELIEKVYNFVTNLLDHGHYGPFEHPQITFAVNGVSRSLMAQLTRHRHATFDVQSMRYVDFEDIDPSPGEGVVLIPELDDPGISGRNAEFADEFKDMDDNEILEKRRKVYRKSARHSFMAYNELLDLGVAPENARMVLPIGTKINLVFSVNARTLLHISDMRAAADAQWEIREMTNEVLALAKDWMPCTFTFYEEEMKHRKNRLAP